MSLLFYTRTKAPAPFKWYLYDAPTSGGPPGALLVYGSWVALPGTEWTDVTTFCGKSSTRTFYVAFEWYDPETEPSLGNDIHGTRPGNWEYYWLWNKNGPWRRHKPAQVNYMIRAWADDTAVSATSLGRVKALFH